MPRYHLQQRSRPSYFLLLVVVLAAQILVLGTSDPIGVFPLLGVSISISRIVGVSFRNIAATVSRIVLIVTPVLVVRLIVGMPLIGALLDWSLYAGRLVAAAVIARGYYHAVGATGIYQGLSVPLQLLPRSVAYQLGHIVSSSLYLIPGVTSSIRTTFMAARLRYARRFGTKRNDLARTASVFRTVLIALLSVPQGRAEAMVIRGLYRTSEKTRIDHRKGQTP